MGKRPGGGHCSPDSWLVKVEEKDMAWLMLVGAGVMESVWAVALGKSQGFSQLVPTIVFVVALVLSMAGLSFALRTLPVGTAYAVWVGIGAALTVIYGMISGDEPVNFVRIALIAGLVLCIVGLKLVSGEPSGAGTTGT